MAAQLAPPDAAETPDGATVDDYVAHAVRNRPELRASLARWQSARARIDAVDELPPLEVSYGYYASRVETRVGPQRHRVRVAQGFIWPGAVERQERARSRAAEVEGVRYDAELLAIRWQVIDAYWALWAVEKSHEWHLQHQEIVRLLADGVRGRVEVGMASLADVGQAELLVSRTADAEAQTERQHEMAALEFARVAGVDGTLYQQVLVSQPIPRVPDEPDEELVAAAMEHPEIGVWAAREIAAQAEIESVGAARYPRFGVGVEWMETGPALDPTMEGSGRDAVVGTVSLMLPLWNGEVAASEKALRAQASSFAASGEVAQRDAATRVRQTLVDIRDSARRIALYERTLAPQAEAVLGSVRGAYETGQTGVASLLRAQDELLELRVALVSLQARHERDWAKLERLVGRPVAAQEVQ